MTVEKVAVLEDGTHFYIGLSSDTKPLATAAPPGSRFYELGTYDSYIAVDGAWSVAPPKVALTGGLVNGGFKVADVYQPARDIFLDWFFGADDTLETITVDTENEGNWIEISQWDPYLRQIVIVNGNAAPSFSYTVYLSRNGLDVDKYVAKASAASTAQFTAIDMSAPTLGHDLYVRLDINPDVGQTGDKLTFQAYAVGRGG